MDIRKIRLNVPCTPYNITLPLPVVARGSGGTPAEGLPVGRMPSGGRDQRRLGQVPHVPLSVPVEASSSGGTPAVRAGHGNMAHHQTAAIKRLAHDLKESAELDDAVAKGIRQAFENNGLTEAQRFELGETVLGPPIAALVHGAKRPRWRRGHFTTVVPELDRVVLSVTGKVTHWPEPVRDVALHILARHISDRLALEACDENHRLFVDWPYRDPVGIGKLYDHMVNCGAKPEDKRRPERLSDIADWMSGRSAYDPDKISEAWRAALETSKKQSPVGHGIELQSFICLLGQGILSPESSALIARDILIASDAETLPPRCALQIKERLGEFARRRWPTDELRDVFGERFDEISRGPAEASNSAGRGPVAARSKVAGLASAVASAVADAMAVAACDLAAVEVHRETPPTHTGDPRTESSEQPLVRQDDRG